jgi:NAD(P)-dependent dehydrogenase (short-subunit alcohol dehydrogenase family)
MTQKTAIVTGGTRGIGKAIALSLASYGYHVIALYARDRASADALQNEAAARGLNLSTLRGDLSRKEGIDAVLDDIKSKINRVDAFVHCAASGVHRPAHEITTKHLRWTFEINVMAAHELIIALLPLMTDDCRIVGLTSAGATRTIPYYAAVGSSKGALDALFRHLATELAPRGIAINLVCPGMVLTDAVEAFPDREARIAACQEGTPSGKITTPEDVAETVHFLCTSRAGRQIIGQTITIDGGKCIKA